MRWARAALLTAALAACSRTTEPDEIASAPSRSSATVRWRPARSPENATLLEAPARALAGPDTRIVVAAPLRARVVAISVRAGDRVAAGAPLVEVALPEAATAAAEYLAALDQLAAHQRRAAQLAALREEGLTRASDVASAELELARLRGVRDLAATTLRTAGLGTGGAADLAGRGGRTVLRAPRAGTVVKVAAAIGAAATPDEPLVELGGGDSMRVEVALARALPGDAQLEVVLAGVRQRAELVAIAPARDSDGAMRAWFDLEKPVPTGALGKLRAVVARGRAVAVPATAVGRDERGTFVWRREGDKPVRVGVGVLVESGTDAIVTGAAEGEPIADVAAAVQEAL